jgi:hypothetical protein
MLSGWLNPTEGNTAAITVWFIVGNNNEGFTFLGFQQYRTDTATRIPFIAASQTYRLQPWQIS